MKSNAKYMGLVKITALVVLLPIVIYALGIAKTLKLNGELKRVEKLVAEAGQNGGNKGADGNSTAKGVVLDAHAYSEKGLLDSASGSDIKTGTLLHTLMPILRRYEVTAESYTPCLIKIEGDMELYAGELVLAGGFIPLTQALKAIEDMPAGYRIVSSAYRAGTDTRNRKKQLRLTVIFQQLTSKQP